MIDLSNNPYLNRKSSIVSGKEIEFLNWNHETMLKNNPFATKDGIPLDGKLQEYYDYLNKVSSSI